MACSKCVTDKRLWVELTNHTNVCVSRLSSLGSRVVHVVSEVSGCDPVVESTKNNYWLEIGLPIGLICLGIIILLLFWWLQRRGSGDDYGELLDEAVNDGGEDVIHAMPEHQQQPPLPPLPVLTPASGVIV